MGDLSYKKATAKKQQCQLSMPELLVQGDQTKSEVVEALHDDNEWKETKYDHIALSPNFLVRTNCAIL
jgi:exonuclease VII large subunit